MAQIMNHYIDPEDLKQRYKDEKQGEKRLLAYINSVEKARKVAITVSFKNRGIVELAVCKNEWCTRLREVIEGELLNADALRRIAKPPKKVSAKTNEPMKVSDQKRQGHTSSLTIDALERHDVEHNSGPTELRQFSCSDCHRSWWHTVLKSKPVSRCRGDKCGGTRYDALPRDKEFGIARFTCPNVDCDYVFYGYCEGRDCKQCRQCGTFAIPYHHPKWKKRQNFSLNPGAKPFIPRKKQRDSKSATQSQLRDIQPQSPHNSWPTGGSSLPAGQTQGSPLYHGYTPYHGYISSGFGTDPLGQPRDFSGQPILPSQPSSSLLHKENFKRTPHSTLSPASQPPLGDDIQKDDDGQEYEEASGSFNSDMEAKFVPLSTSSDTTSTSTPLTTAPPSVSMAPPSLPIDTLSLPIDTPSLPAPLPSVSMAPPSLLIDTPSLSMAPSSMSMDTPSSLINSSFSPSMTHPSETTGTSGSMNTPSIPPFFPSAIIGNEEPALGSPVELDQVSTASEPLQPKIKPRKPYKRVFNCSQKHVPEGGTLSTFLSQLYVEQEVYLDYDSDEEDEEKVAVHRFRCRKCKHEYKGICRMQDTTKCYECEEYNRPMGPVPPGDFITTTTNKHSCSECDGSGNCPNMIKFRTQRK